MTAPKRVWLYGRIDRGGRSQVLDMQTSYLRCWAKEHGWVVAGETREIRSGLFPDRPGLREVAQAASDRQMEAVVITSMTRLCRSFMDAYAYTIRLQKLGVGVISVKVHVTPTTPAICS